MSLLPPVSKWHGAADVKFKLGKLSGASGGVVDAQTSAFPLIPLKVGGEITRTGHSSH
jgi:hypothetical protein